MSIERILITGGAGLIGLETARQLRQRGLAVRLLDLPEQFQRVDAAVPEGCERAPGSVLDAALVARAAQGCDAVIHLAALLGVKRSESDRLRCIDINIEGTRHVLDAAAAVGARRVTFASSSEVYGEPIESPITEASLTQGKSVYAVTKLAGEELCKAYHQKQGLSYTILRYFNCYGPHQTAQFVIARFILNVMQNRPPVVFGSGRQVRSYTYVQDTAAATVAATLAEAADGQVLNISNDREAVDLVELARRVIRVAGKAGRIEPKVSGGFDDADRVREREVFHRVCLADKAQRLLNWRAQVSLDEGIGRVFESGAIYEDWPA